MVEHLSPKQLAAAIGVSESSVKRWCDQGQIATRRTAGGHRRVAIVDVLRFLRDKGYPVVKPELLGLNENDDGEGTGLEQAAEQLRRDLLAGNNEAVRNNILGLFLARFSLAAICDQVIAPAFVGIGDGWAHHKVEVYQEHRGSEIILRSLFELRLTTEAPRTNAPLAIGGSMAPDLYSIANNAAELCLRDAGWQSENLGPNNPAGTLAAALRDRRPRLFWLSVSHLADREQFLIDYDTVYDAALEVGAAVVVGGCALGEDLRKQMRYAAHGDTMVHLLTFAAALWRRPS